VPALAARTLALALGIAAAAGCNDEPSDHAVGGGGSGGAAGAGGSPGIGGDVSNVLVAPELGDPELLSAQRVEFGPGGVLLIGDGRSDRMVAIETGDADARDRESNAFARADNLTGQAAHVIGDNVMASELQIDDIAVNPISWRTYVAITRYTTFQAYVMWVDGEGVLHPFDLENVIHATVAVPAPEGPSSFINEMGWTDGWVIGAITPQATASASVALVATPFENHGPPMFCTTKVYASGTWQDSLSLDNFVPFEHLGEVHLAASFPAAMVRFRVADLATGSAGVRGDTVFQLSAFGPIGMLDFALYDRGEKSYIAAIIYNLLTDGVPRGARIDGAILHELDESKLNDGSPLVFDTSGNPLIPGVERFYLLDEAQRLAPRGERTAVVLRNNTLIAVELP
jgi:hypothetical protein